MKSHTYNNLFFSMIEILSKFITEVPLPYIDPFYL